MSPQPTHPPPPPVVQRLRIRYAKRDRLRFTSHRDFARAFERALRRAGIPMAYSAGFSPHPKVSYAGAASTGVASEAEYLEIGLAQRCDPDQVRRDLDAALPPGLDVLDAVEAVPGGPGLAEQIEASHWRVVLPRVTAETASEAVARLLAAESAPVERLMKDGPRIIDVRPAVLHMRVTPASAGTGTPAPDEQGETGDCATIDVVVRHTTPAVRPDDVLKALRQAAALTTPVTPKVTRLAQGRLAGAPAGDVIGLLDPLHDSTEHPAEQPPVDVAVAAPPP